MFEFLLIAAALIAVGGLIIAYDGSRDVFHPLLFIAPMLGFLYAWMPWKLVQSSGLDRFFDPEQLRSVQTLNVLGILAFVTACLAAGVRINEPITAFASFPDRVTFRLLLGSAITGGLGLLCWLISIINVGGFVNAFSNSYAGGWDDSGYIRDGSLLLLVGVLLAMTSMSAGGPRLQCSVFVFVFGLPWATSAVLMGRRGPTFGLIVVLLMGWYLNRTKRPPLLAMVAGGLCLGWLVLFLVTNRSSIYLGSDFNMKTDVSNIVEKPDTGNEYIYGTGTVIASEKRNHYFWMRRYLAQLFVRPVPSALWPTKYEDFGVPELLHNGGTGESFADALGWVGAVGSAPGIVADLWLEVWWFAVPAMAILGWFYGFTWRRAVTRGGPWASQYVILSALSIYMVMQTMEAVIFRTILLSVPCWITWRWALYARVPKAYNIAYPRSIVIGAGALVAPEPLHIWTKVKARQERELDA